MRISDWSSDVCSSDLEWRIFDNPFPGAGPVLLAERIEGDDLPTVLGYGHGDVIRGYDEQWRDGLSPWTIVEEGDRIYGRGTADNKGQHRSEEHTSELQSLMRNSYAVFCLKKKKQNKYIRTKEKHDTIEQK